MWCVKGEPFTTEDILKFFPLNPFRVGVGLGEREGDVGKKP